MHESVCPPRMRYSLSSRLAELKAGPLVAAAVLERPPSTVGKVLRRFGCSRLPCSDAFLRRAVAWYAEHGIAVERVLSDNAKAYHSHLWRDTCAELEIARRYTRPYSPWTNGKAEALIKTLLREWAYRCLPRRAHTPAALFRLHQVVQPSTTARLARRSTPISRVSHVCGQYI